MLADNLVFPRLCKHGKTFLKNALIRFFFSGKWSSLQNYLEYLHNELQIQFKTWLKVLYDKRWNDRKSLDEETEPS